MLLTPAQEHNRLLVVSSWWTFRIGNPLWWKYRKWRVKTIGHKLWLWTWRTVVFISTDVAIPPVSFNHLYVFSCYWRFVTWQWLQRKFNACRHRPQLWFHLSKMYDNFQYVKCHLLGYDVMYIVWCVSTVVEQPAGFIFRAQKYALHWKSSHVMSWLRFVVKPLLGLVTRLL